MLELIQSVNSAVNNFIWGVPAMICIIGVGLLLTIKTKFLQIRKFPYAMKETLGRVFKKQDASDGSMTPFQAVCTALASTVGTGNIAGVAGAIAIGGPGAVFWMWVTALIGSSTAFIEATLSQIYKRTAQIFHCTVQFFHHSMIPVLLQGDPHGQSPVSFRRVFI